MEIQYYQIERALRNGLVNIDKYLEPISIIIASVIKYGVIFGFIYCFYKITSICTYVWEAGVGNGLVYLFQQLVNFVDSCPWIAATLLFFAAYELLKKKQKNLER